MTRATTVPPVSGSGLGAAAPSRLGRAATQSGAARPAGESGAGVTSDDACRAAWGSLAAWLREGRLVRGMSIADVARTTKIQARILEDLEDAVTEGLPADVFVRGFVRNYARCVGLSEAEALARYAACSRDAGPVASPAATAVAEMYAPAARRMSTVVPVAPGSPAAEVHAQGRPLESRYARAATAPSLLSSSPRLPRAVTDRGAELSPELLEQPPRDARELREPLRSGVHAAVRAPAERRSAEIPAVVYPRPTGSGLTSTVEAAAIAAAVAEAGRPAAEPAPVAAAAVASLASPSSPSSPTAPAVAAPAVQASHQHEWPSMVGGQSRLSAKKRRSKKRKEQREREQQAAAPSARPRRAETVRAPIDIFESEALERDDQALAPAAVTGEISGRVGHISEPSSEAAASAAPELAAPAVSEASIASAAEEVRQEGWPGAVAALAAAALPPASSEEAPAEVWIPRMPPAPRPSRAFQAPTLTIDDADPESASQLQDDRVRDREGRDPTRRTFLPPILLESQDRANRQGGLTLAVIILLIAATLTLSYLMRRPSSAGGGMTQLDTPVLHDATATFVG